LRSLGQLIADGCEGRRAARLRRAGLRKRARQACSRGRLEAQAKLGREIHRIDAAFSERLGQYSGCSAGSTICS
jgi:hypothetical protein